MKDEIEFQPLDPLPSPPEAWLTAPSDTLTKKSLNESVNAIYNHYIDSLRYSPGHKWILGEELNYTQILRQEQSNEEELGSLLENLL